LQRRVFGLAWPVIAENFLETLLGIVDTALVGALGAAALAGVGSAHQILFLLISVLAALSIGCSVLVAQAVGAKDLVRASQLARQSLLWSVVVSIPLAMAGFVFAQPFLSLFNLDPAANEIGLGFTHVTMGTVVVLVALLIGGGVLRGAGDSRTPFMVTAIANVVNVPLAYGLIYGAFGLPQLGAVGSAWATFIARAMALALLVMALWRGRNGVSIRHGLNWRLDLGVIRQVLTIGVPAAIEQVLATLSFTALTILVGTLGTATLAAHRLIITVTSFSFLPGFGFAIAATALIGQAVGAKRFFEIKPIARVAAAWAAMWMGAIGLLLILFAPQALSFFTKDQAVIDSGSMALRLLGIAQAFWGIQFVHNGAMRGMGDTRSPLVVAAGGLWFTVGVAWVLLKIFDGGLTSIWGAFPLTTPLMMLICLWRFNEVLRRFVR
jgi:putative MATE family efflux protein